MQTIDHQLTQRAQHVGIGGFAVGSDGGALRANLGSCVGVCIACPRTGRFALAHVFLPKPRGPEDAEHIPSRFATTVVPFLLDKLGVKGLQRRSLQAYVAGGSALYAASKHQVGASNLRLVLDALEKFEVPVVGRDVGGTAPRQIIVDGAARKVRSIRLGERKSESAWDMNATRRVVVRSTSAL